MKKKTNRLYLHKKQISILNQTEIAGGRPPFSRQCPVETVNITRCYGANVCQKWPTNN